MGCIMAAEIWDLYNSKRQLLGKTMLRGEEIPVGCYHLAVHIWPVNNKGEYLIQKRAATVQWKPNIWAVTGGSAVAGEDALTAAMRELKEELGFIASKEQMKELACLKRSNSFCSVYGISIDQPAEAFLLQSEEVSEVRWCSADKISRMVGEGMLYNYGDSYFRMLFEACNRVF